jgi:dolichyl-phosphate beta-glucosyltransferase
MTAPAQPPFLSIIVPAYNEAERLPAALDALHEYLAAQPYTAEVLVVDDGSVDSTATLVKDRAARWAALRLIETPHRGKGHAVKVGLLESKGQLAFFCDADFSMPVAEIAKFLPETLGEYDVAIASREGPDAHRYNEPFYRHLMGRGFNTLVRWALLPGIQDTQCGFKCLRGDLARELAGIQTIDGWGFDVELLCAARLWGYRIVEVPIDWYHSASSRIHPLRDSWQMVREVLAVRRNARRGMYRRATRARVRRASPMRTRRRRARRRDQERAWLKAVH